MKTSKRIEANSEWIRQCDGVIVRVTHVDTHGVHYYTLGTLVAYVRAKFIFLKHFRPALEGELP